MLFFTGYLSLSANLLLLKCELWEPHQHISLILWLVLGFSETKKPKQTKKRCLWYLEEGWTLFSLLLCTWLLCSNDADSLWKERGIESQRSFDMLELISFSRGRDSALNQIHTIPCSDCWVALGWGLKVLAGGLRVCFKLKAVKQSVLWGGWCNVSPPPGMSCRFLWCWSDGLFSTFGGMSGTLLH